MIDFAAIKRGRATNDVERPDKGEAGDVLLLAYSNDHSLTVGSASASQLAKQFHLAGFVQVEAPPIEDSDTSNSPHEFQLKNAEISCELPTVRLAHDQETNILDLLPDQLANALSWVKNRADCIAASKSLLARSDRELDFVEGLLETLPEVAPGKPNRPALSRKPDDRRSETIKKHVAEELEDLQEELHLENERLIQPLGALSQLVKENAQRLSEDDLTRAVTPQAIRLRLSSNRVGVYNRQLADSLSQRLRRDLHQMDSEIETIENDILDSFSMQYPSLSVDELKCDLPRLCSRRVWERIENLIDVSEDAEIELPKKGIFDLIGAGRQKVFFLIMFVALLGRMGINEGVLHSIAAENSEAVASWLQAGFMVVLLTTCVGAMFNAVLGWRDEKEEQTRKELTRIRESLTNNAKKILTQAQKEKKSVISSYFKEVSEAANAWVDTHAQLASDSESSAHEKRATAEAMRRAKWQQRQTQLQSVTADVAVLLQYFEQEKTEFNNAPEVGPKSSAKTRASRSAAVSAGTSSRRTPQEELDCPTKENTLKSRSLRNRKKENEPIQDAAKPQAVTKSIAADGKREVSCTTKQATSPSNSKDRPKLQSRFAQRRAARLAKK